jgi:hypothetical protein
MWMPVPSIVYAAEAPGSNCPEGGQRVDFGVDDNNNGVLDGAEIDGSTFVCDGLVSLIAQTAEPDGLNCGTGGTRIDTGIDINGNGVLELAEVTDTEFVCNAGFGLIAADSGDVNGGGGIAGNLYSINSETGVATVIASLTDAVTALSFDANGTLFGTTRGGVSAEGEVVTINVEDGTITPVGPSGLTRLPDMSFAPDWTLFAWTEDGDDLTTIDPATGVATSIASAISSSGSGLAVADDGTIFLSPDSTLRTIDGANASSLTSVAITGATGTINSMTFVNGSLFAVMKTAEGRSLVTINTTTGVATLIGAGGGMSDNADALAAR